MINLGLNEIYLAQVATGNELGRAVLEASISLFESTGESWQRIFDLVIDPTQPLWVASVTIARFIAGVSILFFFLCTLPQSR